VKQMKIIHQDGYTKEELAEFKNIVFTNVVRSLEQLINAMASLHIEFDPENSAERASDSARVLFAAENRKDSDPFGDDLALNMKRLWSDPAIQACYKKANEFQLIDSAQYYLDQLDRICAPDYLPTEQDILRTRVKTTGIVEVKFQRNETVFRVFDVGGQRSERRKWIHCFENVTSIIFFAALSEYDQVLAEDCFTNRMKESLLLFDSIFHNRFFGRTSFILFLNKKDLFEEKIKRSSLNKYFYEYEGPNEFEPAADFIKKKFLDVKKNVAKQIYTHFTCATDTQNVQFVMKSVIDTVVGGSLDNAGLL
jgi:hypothetical protein